MRAPGSNVTVPPLTRAGGGAENGESTRTVPVKYSAGPFREACELPRVIFMALLPCWGVTCACAPPESIEQAVTADNPPAAANIVLRVIMSGDTVSSS